MRKTPILTLVLIIGIFLTLLPIFSRSWFFTHDFVHGARIAEYARGLTDGQLPVIWSKNFGYGYGMPLFLFYAPLPYLAGGLLYLANMDLISIVKVLYLASTVISSMGVFLLVRKMFNTSSGLLASLIYILTPYRAVNLYVRGAVSESFGMAFAPFVLWGVMLAWQKKWFGSLVLAISLTLVALSHNLSLLLILPIALAWLCYLVWQDFYLNQVKNWQILWSKITSVIWGIGLGLGLSAFYLIPAASYQNLTKLQQIVLSGYSDYRHHFLYIRQFFDNFWGYGGSNWGPVDGMSFFLGYGPLFGLGFLVGQILARLGQAVYHKTWQGNRNLYWLSFTAFLGAMCLILTTPKSSWIWQNIQFLSVLQFPWRFLGLVTLILAIVGGGSLSLISLRHKKYYLVVMAVLSLAVTPFFRPASHLTNNQDLYYADPGRIAREMSGILPDYIPKQLPDDILPATQPIYFSTPPVTNLHLIEWQSNRLRLELTQSQAGQVTLSVADFPGWQAQVNRRPVVITTSPDGLISLPTLTGSNLVELKYGWTIVQKLSALISIFALLVLAVISYASYKKAHASITA